MHEDTETRGGRGHDVFAIESSTRPIVNISAPPSWHDEEYAVARADALLITAAPDLYAALARIREELVGERARTDDATLAEIIGVILEKARGERGDTT
jgi:hypothetical protein